jgi:succinate-semialdehyde dehydrogenase/glutarate-semialdehyde dehydrogenase
VPPKVTLGGMSALIPVDPTTGRPTEPIECTPVERIPGMVEAARRAQPEWAETPFERRADLMRRAAERLRARAEELAGLANRDMGKLSRLARNEALGFAGGIERTIENMRRALEPDTLPFDGGVTRVHHVPLGVAGLITPWNFPIGMPLSLLTPALLAGNAAVFKPSEYSTRTGLAVAGIVGEGLPDGVLQTLVGAPQQGRALVGAELDLIAFVGSREVGKEILARAARRAARVVLEMGGKDPMIVAKDADLEAAASFAARGAFRNAGQVCCSVERIYVEREAVPAFLERLVKHAQAASVGVDNGTETAMGPLANESQLRHVTRQVESAVERGAKLVMGGRRADQAGFFFEPTILADCAADMPLMQTETFGPVAAIQPVDSVDEAIRLANATRYGLAGTIWMGDEEEARRKALRIEAGLVGVNRSFGGHPDAPWAGAKESGFGHTGGISGARSFLQPRSVTTRQ